MNRHYGLAPPPPPPPPKLVDGNLKNFMSDTLRASHYYKVNYYMTILNFAFVFFLIFFIYVGIKYCQYAKPTEEEKYKSKLEAEAFILRTASEYKEKQVKIQQNLLTGLPIFDNVYDSYVNYLKV